jgi:hypothetical protein
LATRIRRAARRSIPAADEDELWRLYAASRANDMLLLRTAHGSAADLSVPDYADFMNRLGFTVVDEKNFSPFFHEIVDVDQAAKDDQPIAIVAQLWPAVMLGDMMFSRAGVRVSGGRRHVRRDIAETSTLYWTYRRDNRPCHDLSRGWGSNSQWRTRFRRDYRVGDMYVFNVDETNDLRQPSPQEDPDGLTRAERIELLMHRCFITVDKPSTDLWPYNDAYQIGASNVADVGGR